MHSGQFSNDDFPRSKEFFNIHDANLPAKEKCPRELRNHLMNLLLHLQRKYPEERISLNQITEGANLPTIYAITPTYRRPVQKAELIRLAHTFAHVPDFHWIVVEDGNHTSSLVKNLLLKFPLKFTLLNIATPLEFKPPLDPKLSWMKPRGVLQRNLGLQWLRENLVYYKDKGVVYFADDDNVYDLQVFEEMRHTKLVSVWPVALSGGLLVERPLVKDGKVVGFNSIWRPKREFPIDMAGFAINLGLILSSPKAEFNLHLEIGDQESYLLRQLVNVSELEPKANNCTKVLAWHTKTETPKLNGELKLRKYGKKSNEGIEL